MTRAGLGSVREDVIFEDDDPPVMRPTTTSASTGEAAGFFEHELRGYRLLKAAKLSQAERQHVLTLTRNSTHFNQIRQALRSLFADGADQADDHGRLPRRTAWLDHASSAVNMAMAMPNALTGGLAGLHPGERHRHPHRRDP